MTMPQCVSNDPATGCSRTYSAEMESKLPGCAKYETSSPSSFRGSFFEDNAILNDHHGNWSVYKYLPKCWTTLEPALCGVLRASCQNNSDASRIYPSLTKLHQHGCNQMLDVCPFVKHVYQHVNSEYMFWIKLYSYDVVVLVIMAIRFTLKGRSSLCNNCSG